MELTPLADPVSLILKSSSIGSLWIFATRKGYQRAAALAHDGKSDVCGHLENIVVPDDTAMIFGDPHLLMDLGCSEFLL